MNRAYERYLQDEAFRADILAAAKRERAKALSRFFSGLQAIAHDWHRVLRLAGAGSRLT